ncbi:MAG: prepilin-type N-terminal cleavage/methylation domain-containing protein [Syntrophaceae bacterium]|nr:prepilin-type N-terminal cleavage/methylation domain-containing protein [Syntrophaceae bacterium]
MFTKGTFLRKSQRGFTLVEVIVSLVVAGILAAVAGLGIVQAVKGYVKTKQNAEMTQKVQLAMSRITQEVIEMINIPNVATSTFLPITGSNNCNGSDCIRTIGLDGNKIKIAFGSANISSVTNGDTLLDNVQSLTFKYYMVTPETPSDVPKDSFTPGTDPDFKLCAVDVKIEMVNSSGDIMEFQNRISPRNNNNLGGKDIPKFEDIDYARYRLGCFVATAAYGNSSHPMVQILRDFRDRYLLSFQGGKWFVKQYYKYGPVAADLIRNRPLAMGAVRCLLAPVAALAFGLMYAPMAIIFVLLVSVILTSALFSVFRRRFPERLAVFRSRGSILIGLIVTMVIMAVLAAAMVSMFSSSYVSSSYADCGRKAYFMAESGFRYAASRYLWANSDTAKEDAILDLNGGTSGLTSPEGGKTGILSNGNSFNTKVAPLFFLTTSYTASNLTTRYVGTAPAEMTADTSGGYIMVGTDSAPAFYSYNSHAVSGATITFNNIAVSPPTTSISLSTPDVDVRPVALTSGGTLSKGGNLTLNSTGAGALPPFNGNFTLVSPSGVKITSGVAGGDVFNYKSRIGNTLYNINLYNTDANSKWSSSISVPASTNVVLAKFLRLTSTGTAACGISRTVTYETPIGRVAVMFEPQEGGSDGSSSANWVVDPDDVVGGVPTFTGTINVGAPGKTTSGIFFGFIGAVTKFILDILAGIIGLFFASCEAPDPLMNIFAFDWANTPANLAQAWVDAQGFSSYDLQTKVEANGLKYFFAGMMFKGRNVGSYYGTYGISFVKPRRYYDQALLGCATCLTTDQIGNLIPGWAGGSLYSGSLEQTNANSRCYWSKPQYDYGLPAIVLWKLDTSGNFNWLAYRTLTTSDGIVTYDSGTKAWRLNPDFSTVLVRVAEGYAITFDNGIAGMEIKEGDIISNATGTRTARVVMTPILNSGTSWGAGAAGTLVVANVNNGTSGATFSSGALYKGAVQVATATGFNQTKKNYIRAYFSRPTALGTANSVETDNNRLANPVGSHNWPPDDLADLNSSNDYYTLVQWTGTNGLTNTSSPAAILTSTSEPSAIISDSSLVSPSPSCMTSDTTKFTCQATDFVIGSYAADTIALFTADDNTASISYDDFYLRVLLKSGGVGFLGPIQH